MNTLTMTEKKAYETTRTAITWQGPQLPGNRERERTITTNARRTGGHSTARGLGWLAGHSRLTGGACFVACLRGA